MTLALMLLTATQLSWANDKAEVRKEIQAKSAAAMVAYDGLEYEQARTLLTEAMALAQTSRVDAEQFMAMVHIHLGIVYFAGLAQPDSAKLEFLTAAQIDEKVQIPPAYRRADMATLLEEARTDAVAARQDSEAARKSDFVDCEALRTLLHKPVEAVAYGSNATFEVYLPPKQTPRKLVLFFRTSEMKTYEEVAFSKGRGCGYTATLTAEQLRGKVVHYYVSAVDADGNVLGKSGSASTPNIIELATPGIDSEEPGTSKDTEETPRTRKPPTVLIAMGVGSGAGYVTGKTEDLESNVQCCVAPAFLTLQPELGFFLSARTSLSVVGRIGILFEANSPHHATMSPAAFVRLRHTFSDEGSGLMLAGSLGGGAVRDVVEVADGTAGANMDTVAMGPLLVGAGIGYTKQLTGPLRFIIELQLTAGLPVTKTLGSARLGVGVQGDGFLGLQTAF